MTTATRPVSVKRKAPDLQAAAACAKTMCACSFDGRFDDFHKTLDNYLREHGQEDPHARHVMEAATTTFGLLGYRSTTADRDDWEQQNRIRWDAWLAVLPLNLQLNLLLMEADPRSIANIDLGAVKWDQLRAVREARTPQAFLASPLHDEKRTRQQCENNVARNARNVAENLLAWKEWSLLEQWMEAAHIHACDPINEVGVHYRTPSSRGTTMANTRSTLPFWMAGLYSGAVEPEFWLVMAQAGGPEGPGAFADQPGIPSYHAPLDLIEPQARLDEAAIALMTRTAAVWQQQALEANTAAAVPASRKGQRRL